MGDRTRGLYDKFQVRRNDGTSESGQKHNLCDYFVLDLTHDPHAIPALFAYADECDDDGYKQLAEDLRARARNAVTRLQGIGRDAAPEVK